MDEAIVMIDAMKAYATRFGVNVRCDESLGFGVESQALPMVTREAPPAQSTVTPAPVVEVPEPMPAIKKEGYVLKKAAAIKKYSATWPTIVSDLNHANENGLTKAAKAPIHGEWYETGLRAWADSRGKRTVSKPEIEVVSSVFNLPGTKHTLKG